MKVKKEFYFTGNQIVCLLVHGFTGSPGEMLPLGQYLNKCGYTVKGILLPGHGTTPEDLRKTDWQDWYGKLIKEYNSLAKKYNKVFVIGLSMGGLLTLYLASQSKITGGIASLCAPIYIADKRVKITPLLKYFKKYIKKPGNGNKYPGYYWYDCYPVRSLANLLKLIKVVKINLENITCPTLLIQAKKDGTIDPSSAQFIYSQISTANKELIWLGESGHIVTLDKEKEKVFLEIEKFIVENLKGEA